MKYIDASAVDGVDYHCVLKCPEWLRSESPTSGMNSHTPLAPIVYSGLTSVAAKVLRLISSYLVVTEVLFVAEMKRKLRN